VSLEKMRVDRMRVGIPNVKWNFFQASHF